MQSFDELVENLAKAGKQVPPEQLRDFFQYYIRCFGDYLEANGAPSYQVERIRELWSVIDELNDGVAPDWLTPEEREGGRPRTSTLENVQRLDFVLSLDFLLASGISLRDATKYLVKISPRLKAEAKNESDARQTIVQWRKEATRIRDDALLNLYLEQRAEVKAVGALCSPERAMEVVKQRLQDLGLVE